MNKINFLRQIDSLGRIVIPKDVRKVLNIKKNDFLEMYIEGKSIIIKRKEFDVFFPDSVLEIFKLLSDKLHIDIIISDLNKYIFIEGKNYKDLLNMEIDKYILKKINDRKYFVCDNDELFFNKSSFIFEPIFVNGDVVLSILYVKDKGKISDIDIYSEKIISNLVYNFLDV